MTLTRVWDVLFALYIHLKFQKRYVHMPLVALPSFARTPVQVPVRAERETAPALGQAWEAAGLAQAWG